MTTKLTPASLSSRPARQQLAHRSDEPVFIDVFRTIDRLKDLHTALSDLRTTPNPELTKEGRAKKYKEQFERATSEAQRLSKAAAERLVDFEAAAKSSAEKAAGLTDTLPHAEAAEIRAALRGMDQEQRDKAITQAADRSDTKILAAVRDASPVLTGGFTAPLEPLLALIVEKKNPGIRATLADVEAGLNRIRFAFESFSKDAQGMRDLGAEERADEYAQKTEEAQRLLNGSAA